MKYYLNNVFVIWMVQMVSHKPIYSFLFDPTQDNHSYIQHLHLFELVHYCNYDGDCGNHISQLQILSLTLLNNH